MKTVKLIAAQSLMSIIALAIALSTSVILNLNYGAMMLLSLILVIISAGVLVANSEVQHD
ncbi:hypothetical protein ACFPVV_01575 [Macrococcoides bohemicum]|uniref:Uncharacterized protein n=1 Tax=Macrococcoides bohemicum TaxID=1903056 RepID=A0A328A7B7_9STAP|nr:hypothetical protein [Macrococcus bohemicus]RAK50176.1 hypothetical protein BHX94_01550 [Macrococcus bohemicus]